MFNPRILRAAEAPKYLGVGVTYFNKHIRPKLTEVKFGNQIVCFDRKELDAFADKLFELARKKKETSSKTKPKEMDQCQRKSLDSSKEETSGISINKSEVSLFMKAQEHLTGKKQRSI